MKTVQVLGPGCRKCDETAAVVREVVAESGVDAEIVKVDDLKEITAMGVFATPAVAVDGVVKVTGRVPRKDDVKAWLA